MKGLVMTKIVWLLIGVVGIVVAWGVLCGHTRKEG
jgi:hypothetical protein